jgi:hypothetical protein
MSEPRDPLLDAIHAAGEVPPPPDRDAAFARAMRPVLVPSRRRLNRSVIALFAAALLAVPAAVFAERASHTPPATITPITFEKPDPHSSIQHEADDATMKRESKTETEHSGTGTDDHSGTSGNVSGETEHSGGGTTSTTDGHDGSVSSGSDGSGSSGGDTISTPEPTPIPSATASSGGGLPDGGSSGSPDGGTSGSN